MFTTSNVVRPEDRQRSGREAAAGPGALYRSEAFAEDLDGPEAAGPAAAPLAARRLAQPLRLMAWSAAAGLGLLPVLAGR